jgi:hypothetical protein
MTHRSLHKGHTLLCPKLHSKKIRLSFRSWRQLAGATGTCGKILNRPKEMNAINAKVVSDTNFILARVRKY